MDLKKAIREIENFPKEGINFKDITTLMQDGETFKYTIDAFINELKDKNVDVIVGPEARGFLMGTPVAYGLGVGFVPVRKPGKLPSETKSYSYGLEYGSDTLQIHKDAIKPGQRVVIVDDLLATGGTMEAADYIYGVTMQEKAISKVLSLKLKEAEEIIDAIEKAKECKDKPTAVVCNTVKGKGSSIMENKANWHHKVTTTEEYETIMKDLITAEEALS